MKQSKLLLVMLLQLGEKCEIESKIEPAKPKPIIKIY